MGTINKLSVDTDYLLYTNYNSIPGVKVKVTGVMNYDEAILLPFSITAIAINEKVVDPEGDTEEYLRKQLFYKCITKDVDSNETVYVVWDDIINSEKTTRLSVDYNYTLKLTVDSSIENSISDIVSDITSYIITTYGSQVTPELTQIGIGVTENNELEEYKQQLDIAKTVISKLASLKQIETLIDYFAKDDMNEKLVSINEQLGNIMDTVNTISDLVS